MPKKQPESRSAAFLRLSRLAVAIALILILLGLGIRVYAYWLTDSTELRLNAARPTAPTPHGLPGFKARASAPPSFIRMPDYGLWNTLEPITLDQSLIIPEWRVNDAGWHSPSDWSGLPGYGGNVVISGHNPGADRSIWPHTVFQQLAYLKPGDRIEVTAGETFRYRVAHVFSVLGTQDTEREATSWITKGQDERLTLVSCWPPDVATYRVVVVAYPESEEKQ